MVISPSENSSGYHVNRSMNILDPSDGSWIYTLNISNLKWQEIVSFHFYANDSYGLIGINDNLGMNYLIKREDYDAPISEIVYMPFGNELEVTSSTIFTINSDDDKLGSGINKIFYLISYPHSPGENISTLWIEYDGPFVIAFEHLNLVYHIYFYAVDNAGNVEKVKFITVYPVNPPNNHDLLIASIIIGLTSIGIVSGIVLYLKKHSSRLSS